MKKYLDKDEAWWVQNMDLVFDGVALTKAPKQQPSCGAEMENTRLVGQPTNVNLNPPLPDSDRGRFQVDVCWANWIPKSPRPP